MGLAISLVAYSTLITLAVIVVARRGKRQRGDALANKAPLRRRIGGVV
jgi:hypothetical protein